MTSEPMPAPISTDIDEAIATALVSIEAIAAAAGSHVEPATMEELRRSLAHIRSTPHESDGDTDAGLQLIFDVSDLLGYFPDNRAPTGIQRVQMEVITALLARPPARKIRICRFLPDRGSWVQVPPAMFLPLCEASRAGGDPGAPDWRKTYDRLNAATRSGGAMDFGADCVLINLGSSWWLKDYFLQIRELKVSHGVRYVPLIHDVIPAKTPQFCDKALVAEFIPWVVDVIDNADYFLANSNATKKDLIEFAGKIGRPLTDDMVGVVQLNADYRSEGAQKDGVRPTFAPIGRPYVLLVSTWEIRKNQIGALSAWRQLINEFGADKVPQLVLVGKQGYRGNEVVEKVREDEVLASRVTLLQKLSDAELAHLYRNCLFTLYPSAYEGWGLPVTEALCYGKVPLVANNSSLPEAGGSFAYFFADGSPSDMLASLKMLISDRSRITARESKIAAEFHPRSWHDIAAEMRDHVTAWHGQYEAVEWSPPHAQVGQYYPMFRRFTDAYWPGMGDAERFRRGVNWWALETWGGWTHPAGARLSMCVDPGREVVLAIAVRNPAPLECEVQVRATDSALLMSSRIAGTQSRWIFVPCRIERDTIDITITSDRSIHPDGDWRQLSVGVSGFFLIDATDPASRRDFIEAVALGSLDDQNAYRKRA